MEAINGNATYVHAVSFIPEVDTEIGATRAIPTTNSPYIDYEMSEDDVYCFLIPANVYKYQIFPNAIPTPIDMGEAVDIANAFRGGDYDSNLLKFLLGCGDDFYEPNFQADTYVDHNRRYPLHGFVNYEEYINILQYCLNKIKNNEPIDITYEQCVERCFGNLKVGIKELLKIGQWDKDIIRSQTQA